MAFNEDQHQRRSAPASFEAKEPGKVYKGVERRRQHRRANKDRREEMRFELKPDRRQCTGRRADDKTPKFWG